MAPQQHTGQAMSNNFVAVTEYRVPSAKPKARSTEHEAQSTKLPAHIHVYSAVRQKMMGRQMSCIPCPVAFQPSVAACLDIDDLYMCLPSAHFRPLSPLLARHLHSAFCILLRQPVSRVRVRGAFPASLILVRSRVRP